MTEQRAHHEACALFPMMKAADFQQLKTDIAANGLREAIWLHPDGSIIDGRNRHSACLELGIKPRFRTWDGSGSLVLFVVSLNLHRRHLTASQRAVVALDLLPMLEEEARQRMTLGKKFPRVDTGKAVQHAADKVNTNARYVSDAKKLAEQAPDLLAEVRTGEKTIPQAKREAKKRTKAHELEQMKRHIEEEQLPEIIPGILSLNTVGVCAIKDVELPAGSVDMIFTDPPYHDEHIGLYGSLGNLAAHVLKPGGYLMAYAGKMFLPDILAKLLMHLEYVSTFAVFQAFSKARIMKHNIFENWRPIVALKQPGATTTKEWVQDVVRGKRDKGFHEWQQDEEAPLQYIAAYTKPGDVVLDPFCGAGTTAHACNLLGRYYVAFDSDIEAVRLTLARLNETNLPQP